MIARLAKPAPEFAMKLALAALAALLLATPAAAKGMKMYSYDSVTPVTRDLTENGLTFVFKPLMTGGAVVRRVLVTENVGAADLKPINDDVLGRGGLKPLIGDAPERALYEITSEDDGTALIHVLCPGADRGFLAFGRLKLGEPLRVHALGLDSKTHAAKLCVTLDYAFHGEWNLPYNGVGGRAFDPLPPIVPTLAGEGH